MHDASEHLHKAVRISAMPGDYRNLIAEPGPPRNGFGNERPSAMIVDRNALNSLPATILADRDPPPVYPSRGPKLSKQKFWRGAHRARETQNLTRLNQTRRVACQRLPSLCSPAIFLGVRRRRIECPLLQRIVHGGCRCWQLDVWRGLRVLPAYRRVRTVLAGGMFECPHLAVDAIFLRKWAKHVFPLLLYETLQYHCC